MGQFEPNTTTEGPKIDFSLPLFFIGKTSVKLESVLSKAGCYSV
jgi:hypothetical protein